jgi:hypothetical protein
MRRTIYTQPKKTVGSETGQEVGEQAGEDAGDGETDGCLHHRQFTAGKLTELKRGDA